MQKRGLSGHTLPLVGRTFQLPGLVYREADWASDRAAGAPCHLLNLPPTSLTDLSPEAQEYVLWGEGEGVHTGYKCRIRKLWYVAPTLWAPDAFLFRQIHHYPKMALNLAQATATDTIHRVRFHDPERGPQITLSFMNSLTFAFSEVMGRSYGGGVLELEPNEAERLPLPSPTDAPCIEFAELDCLERAGRIDDLLDLTDAALLRDGLGFDAEDVRRFRTIWRKLSGRRVGRKVRAARREPTAAGQV